MNILLSELQSPGLEQPPGAPAPTSDGQEFAQMLQQNLQANPGHNGNVIEVKGFLEQFETLDEPAELTIDRPGKDWSAYALRLEHSPDDADEGLILLQQSLLPVDNADTGETLLPSIQIQLRGENLPVSGNSLPVAMPPASSQIGESEMAAITPAPVPALAPARLDPGLLQPDAIALPEAITSTTTSMPAALLKIPPAATGQQEPPIILPQTGPALESSMSTRAGPLPGALSLQGETRIAQAGMAPVMQAAVSELQPKTGPIAEPLPGKSSLPVEPEAQTDNLLQNVVKASQSTFNTQDSEALPINNPSPTQPLVNIASHTAAAHTVTASLNQASIASPGIPMPTQLQSMALASPADSIEWSNGLGERVSWMIDQKQNVASIRLDPPTLGKLEVQIRLGEDSTSVSILTQHAQTRELIDSASLRLRDILQEAGYQNVSVDVSQRQDQQRAATQQAQPQDSDDMVDNAAEPQSAVAPGLAGYSVKGLVDTFA